MSQPHELKSLETQLGKIRGKRDAAIALLKSTETELKDLQSRESALVKRIAAFKESSSKPIVSEHAMLRYFERVLGFDLSEIANKILTEDVLKMMSETNLTNGKFPVKDKTNFRAIVRQNTVVSIETNG